MPAFAKTNKVVESFDLNFRFIKHEKVAKAASIIIPFAGQFEVQLLKYHDGEIAPCLSTFGDTYQEAWASMAKLLIGRQENHFKNTLALSDYPDED